MSDPLRCPSCSGPMDIQYIKPNDKIARCPYCEKVVDLPDKALSGKKKITHIKQNETGKGFRKSRTVRVVESEFSKDYEANATSKEDVEKLMRRVADLMEKGRDINGQEVVFEIVGDDPEGFETSWEFTRSEQDDQTFITRSDEIFQDRDVKEKIEKAFEDLRPILHDDAGKKRPRKSFWRRLFKKK